MGMLTQMGTAARMGMVMDTRRAMVMVTMMMVPTRMPMQMEKQKVMMIE